MPHDLPIDAKAWDAIDAAIRVREKVLLILLKNAIASDWVEDEVVKTFAEERRRDQLVLFPVRIDDTVMETSEPWVVKLRDKRHIDDFRRWTPRCLSAGLRPGSARSEGDARVILPHGFA